ncbi:proteoglycan 4a [Chanos chanos]|uniref:Proteoglycan 4a n=1 Tax=Chanos chanos TaxID=29144 RepID=A0A6J2VF66_CHACN|nr:proteoglycan 4-like [Chanos chanos]
MAGFSLISTLMVITCILLPLCAAQASCNGRCGEPFSRGQVCNCDYDCLTHGECCKDFEAVCLTKPPKSKTNKKSDVYPLKSKKPQDSESDEVTTDYTETPVVPTRAPTQVAPNAFGGDVNKPGPSEYAPGVLDNKGKYVPISEGPMSPLNPGKIVQHSMYPTSPEGTVFPTANSPMPAGGPAQAGGPSSGKPLTIPFQVSLSINGPSGGLGSGPSRPSTLADIAEALGATNPTLLPNGNYSPDLCADSPIDALAALFNGSIIVFRGHFFWLVDPRTKTPGPAQSIVDVLGIPSPIDTAFTRSNCQGKTYIIKGDNYWVFENGVMEPGYPRSVSVDFGGLTGQITAALSVPATRKRPESVYFFKKGGLVQKMSYPSGSGPSCSGKKGKTMANIIRSRHARQAGIQLTGEINITLSWKGFPTPVTSALTMPNPRKPDGYDYFIFSWPKVFNIKITAELPALASPANGGSPQNISSWLNCP